MFLDHVSYESSQRETEPSKLEVPEHVEDLNNGDEEARWRRRTARTHTRMNKRDAQALAEQPDGKRLFVQCKVVSQRSRMGLQFTLNARRMVVVVDETDSEVAALNAAGGVDVAGPDGNRQKAAAVTPLGAKAILSDDGLMVFEAPAAVAEAQVAALKSENVDLKQQLADAQAKLVALRQPSADGSDGSVIPGRLKKTPTTAPSTTAIDTDTTKK